jgi:rhodanese-related sulfurtransferase
MKSALIRSFALSFVFAGYAVAGCGSCAQRESGGSPAHCSTGDGGCRDGATVKAVGQAEIGTQALGVLLASSKPAVVLDARTGKFDDGRRIPGAKLLAPDATAEQAAAVIPSKDTLVVTYCSGVKCPASVKLAERLRSLGFSNVLEYRPGIAGWVEAGNKVEKTQ